MEIFRKHLWKPGRVPSGKLTVLLNNIEHGLMTVVDPMKDGEFPLLSYFIRAYVREMMKCSTIFYD